jgi:DNA-binding PadR family transcriptional regulator
LERDGLVIGAWNERKRVYSLTAKGDETIRAIMNTNDKIGYLVLSLLKAQRQQ